MHPLMLILGLVLLSPTVCALQCYMCIPGATGSCTETQQSCPAEQQCGAVTIRTYVGDMKMDVNMKTCMSADQCVSGSMNFGFTRTFLSSACCSTELCNVLYSQPPISPSPNGKKCYTCTGSECSNVLSCTGDEDRCISGKVTIKGQAMLVKGCASRSLCVSSESHVIPGGMETQATCCHGDLCNRAAPSTAVVHLWFLVVVVAAAPLCLVFSS